MADIKPSAFTEASPASETADYIPYTKDATGTPLDRRVSLRNFFSSINLLTTITDIDSDSGDYILIYQANGTVAKKISVDNLYKGIYEVYIPASAIYPRKTTAPCSALTSTELSTNKVTIQTLDFDTTTQEYAQFRWKLPTQFDGGTITFMVDWTAASGSGGVAWTLAGRAYTDDDALDQAQGTAVTVTDTLITANDEHQTSESSAVTIAGTPTGGKTVHFEISRDPANGSDTLGVDAKLLGIRLRIGINKKASA